MSLNNIQPKCCHFGICGGCKFQHLPYSEQLVQKEQGVKELFGNLTEPILASPAVWGYRNKMEFSFSQAKDGAQFLGLMRRRGRVENLNECHLTSSWFIETLKQVRTWWQAYPIPAYHPHQNRGLLRTLTLREGLYTQEKMAVLTVSGEPFDEKALNSFVSALPALDTVVLRRQILQKKCPTRFEETVLTGSGTIHERLFNTLFRLRAASFFQPNSRSAELVYREALKCAELSGKERVVDLYCGTGTLGLLASRLAETVHGIELIEEAVEDAKANSALNRITNMTVECGDVGEKLLNCDNEIDVVFVDPPRPGLLERTIHQLLRLKPKKIVYISCNPATQVLDCKQLLSAYELVRVLPIDQFPHTPHVENIVSLQRKP